MGRAGPARSAKRPIPVRAGGASPRPPMPGPPTLGRSAAPVTDAASLLQAAVSQHQAGNAAQAEQLYRQVLAIDPHQPDALHLLGVLAYQHGRADLAVPSIERAVARKPSAPSYRLNLGNALLALGRTADAIRQYRKAVQLAPNDVEAHYNLGNALIQHGESDDGIYELRRAVRLSPDHLGAQYNLANAQREAGRLEDAVAAYTRVVRLQPDLLDAQTNLGTTLHALGRHDEARACFERVLAARPDDATAAVNLAESLREQGQLDDAVPHYQHALARATDNPTALRGLAAIWQQRRQPADAAEILARLAIVTPDDATVHERLARQLVASDQPERALAAVVAGLERCPDDRPLVRTLVDLLQDVPDVPPAASQTIRAALLVACTDDTFDAQRLATPIARLIMAAREYPGLLAAAQAGADPFANDLPLPAALLSDPAVLAALPRVVICLPDMERILTLLRRSTLLRWEAPLPTPLPLPFRCALAGAAFLVEHAWSIQPDEAEQLDALRSTLVALLADPAADLPAIEELLILAALYGRLGRLPGAERLADVSAERWSVPFLAVLREHVLEPLEERALAASLPYLTPIDDATSQAVQAMYEENPYPRWRSARFHGPEPMAERYRRLRPDCPTPDWPTPLSVLVAGAGTGQHPIQTALRLPDADVLAVDLSRTSLAYGARMARKLDIGNLRFAQADILALDVLEPAQFALVECGGVLHHLADPMAGWAVLRRLLRPDGLMMIALYSERARAGIVAARELIAAEGIPSTSEGIRAARRRIMDRPSTDPAGSLTRFWDFYSESGFRDLAMHVQEHRFTLPQLAASLAALDLRFLGFDLPPDTMARFRARFPTPGAELDLSLWDQFEADHPDTFASMYQLWCAPR